MFYIKFGKLSLDIGNVVSHCLSFLLDDKILDRSKLRAVTEDKLKLPQLFDFSPV